MRGLHLSDAEGRCGRGKTHAVLVGEAGVGDDGRDPLDRRVVASGSSITGRVTSSREPSHLGSLITGRIASDGGYMELALCGLELRVCGRDGWR